jgi:hypothetical protein
MVDAKTRLDILTTTHRTIDLATSRFSTISADTYDWIRQVHKLENLVRALSIQLTDYTEALDYETEAEKQAEANQLAALTGGIPENP